MAREFEGCDCMELGAQVCSAYESWVSEVQAEEDWNALSFEEQDEVVQSNFAYELQKRIDLILWEQSSGGSILF